jgi:hypothetical protein
MMDLVLALQTDPAQLQTKKITVRDGFKLGKWELFYNELEEEWEDKMDPLHRRPYNACEVDFGA